MSNTPTRDEIVQAAARGYCTDENAHKVLDPSLIEAIADKVMEVIEQ